MGFERIQNALQDAKDTHKIVLGRGVLSEVNQVFSECFGDQPAFVIADENTYAAAGAKAVQLLTAGGRKVITCIFPGQPALYADIGNVEKLENLIRNQDGIPIAVGSGTINDLTKVASHRCGRLYMIIGTAASMDGYTAFAAAITRDGFKQSLDCPAPYAVLADLDVMAKAPQKMTAAGYADLLGKVTAGADWILADELEVEPINKPIWSMVQDSLRTWCGNPHLILSGDVGAVGNLIEGLIITGLAMQAYQNSRPAAGCEHHISHVWEMQEKVHGLYSHGFKVGIGTIASAALYERLVAKDFTRLDVSSILENWPSQNQVEKNIRQAFHSRVMADKAVEETKAKYLSPQKLKNRLTLLMERWPRLRERLISQLMTASELSNMLGAAGCPVQPGGIGVELTQCKHSHFLAWMIRRRYCIFDLATETGCFESCVNRLFEVGGYWG